MILFMNISSGQTQDSSPIQLPQPGISWIDFVSEAFGFQVRSSLIPRSPKELQNMGQLMKYFASNFLTSQADILKPGNDSLRGQLLEKIKEEDSKYYCWHLQKSKSVVFLERSEHFTKTTIHIVFERQFGLGQSFGSPFQSLKFENVEILFVAEKEESKSLKAQEKELRGKISHLTHCVAYQQQPLDQVMSIIKSVLAGSFSKGILSKNEQFNILEKGSKSCSYHILWLKITYLLRGDTDLLKALKFSFDICVLNGLVQTVESAIKQSPESYNQYRSLIQISMLCFQKLRADMESVYTENNYYYSHEKGTKRMLEISEKIHGGLQCRTKNLRILPEEIMEEGFENENNLPSLCGTFPQPNVSTSASIEKLKGKREIEIVYDDIFNRLNLARKYDVDKDSLQEWIMVAEDTVFTYVTQELEKYMEEDEYVPFLNVRVSTIEARHNVDPPEILIFLSDYKAELHKNPDKYGMLLQCQAFSHVELMKLIVAIISFQVFKRESPKNMSLEQFMIPNKVDEIYKNFNSLSFKARKSMQTVCQYFLHNEFDEDGELRNKFFLFGSPESYNSFQKFALKYYECKTSIKETMKKEKKLLEVSKEELEARRKNFKNRYNDNEEELNQYENIIPDSCEFKEEKRGIKKEKILVKRCDRCLKIDALKIKKINLENERDRMIDTSLCQKDQDTKTQMMFQSLSQDERLLGIVIILLDTQADTNSATKYKKLIQKTIFEKNKIEALVMDSKSTKEFNLYKSMKMKTEELILYEKEEVTLLYKSVDKCPTSYGLMSSLNMEKDNLSPQLEEFLENSKLPKEIQRSREHKIYSTYQKRPDKLMNEEEYLSIGSIRVGPFTQLPVLLQYMLKRVIRIDALKMGDGNEKKDKKNNDDSFIFRYMFNLIAKTMSEIWCYHPLQINEQLCQIIESGVQWFVEFFMSNFHKEWAQRDYKSLPIIGPIISLLYKEVNYYSASELDMMYCKGAKKREQPKLERPISTEIFLKINQSILSEYERIEEQNENLQKEDKKKEQKLSQNCQWQMFVCFGAICCYTETIFYNEVEQRELGINFLKFLVAIKSKEIFTLERQKKTKYYSAYQRFNEFKLRAVANNVQYMRNFLKTNGQCLTEIVKMVDELIDEKTQWTYPEDKNKKASECFINIFHGIDSFNNKYELNIGTGEVLINGHSLSRVPSLFKENPYFKRIFGERDFEVCQEKNESKNKDSVGDKYRTRKDLKTTFDGNINTLTDSAYFLFEFVKQSPLNITENVKDSEGDQEFPSICYVLRYGKQMKEEKWRLLNHEKLSSMLNIPAYFTHQYLPWLCEQRNCIVFRKPELDQMGEIGLVLFLKGEQIQHPRAHVISKALMRGPIDEICQSKNQIFDRIILDSKKDSKVYEILSRIEKVDFIIQLHRYVEGKEIPHFWLHRYGFILMKDPQYGLIPESYINYCINETPYSHKYVPWDDASHIPCLIFQKIIQKEVTHSMHEIKVLVPNLEVMEDGTMSIPTHVSDEIKFLAYDIHDHLHDIRGLDRKSQLHIATILLSLNTHLPMKPQKIPLSGLEYCLKILQSCINNSPLSPGEIQKWRNLFKLAKSRNGCESALIMCEAIRKCTSELLEMGIQEGTGGNYSWKHIMKDYDKMIGGKKTDHQKEMTQVIWKYESRRKNKILPLRQNMTSNVAALIGLSKPKPVMHKRGPTNLWEEKSLLVFTFEETEMAEIGEVEKSLHESFSYKQKILNEKKQISEKEEKAFPISSTLLESQHERVNSILLSEVIEELKSSYHSYERDFSHNNSISFDIKEMAGKFKEINENLKKGKGKIESIFNKMHAKCQNNVDVFTGFRPVFNSLDYVRLLVAQQDRFIYQCYPGLEIMESKDDEKEKKEFELHRQTFLKLLRLWMCITVQIDSSMRIMEIIRSQKQKADKVSLLRQIQSPRQLIEDPSKIYWVCFQVENKLQIWFSQYQTFESLRGKSSKNGTVSQLNMGQGKTQVIIPMIALDLLYTQEKSTKMVPRVNLLQALFNESKTNYYRFLSVTSFNIPIIELPFDREVDFCLPEIQKNELEKYRKRFTNLLRIKRSLYWFKEKMLILLDQSSTHSLILKLREEALNIFTENANEICKWDKEEVIFQGIDSFDIFDEVDAQMSPKKSFIYSIGKQTFLDEYEVRTLVSEMIIDGWCEFAKKCLLEEKGFVELKNVITYDESAEDVLECLNNGEYPVGLRLMTVVSESQNRRLKKQVKGKILDMILEEVKPYQLNFLSKLSLEELSEIREYILIDEKSSLILNQLKQKEILSQYASLMIVSLRGFFAHEIFQHCLTMRCRVNFGVPGEERLKNKDRVRNKQLAIPYEAADVPSKRNDYAHPDVAILLSYLAYYNSGLDYSQHFRECLDALMAETDDNEESRMKIYDSWHCTLSLQKRQELGISNALEINVESDSQKDKLYRFLKRNRKCISYWLKTKVFRVDLQQFDHSITSSSWDHADVRNRVGFSGTKDNCRLFPTPYLRLVDSENDRIKGTDGKMLDMLIQNVEDVIIIKDVQDGHRALWQRMMEEVLALKYPNIGAIIDSGAILAGKSLKKEIVPWLANHSQFNKRNLKGRAKFKGISFCDNDVWKVLNLSTSDYILKGTSIPDNETFVIFDQYRTRGADMKMKANLIAVLTLSPTLTKDSLMQAVGRLRKIGRNQKLILMMTEETKRKIVSINQDYSDQISKEEKVKSILSWVCVNSVNENEGLLMQNSNLVKIHLSNKIQKEIKKSPIMDITSTKLKEMYKDGVEYREIAQISDRILKKVTGLDKVDSDKRSIIQEVQRVFQKYGKERKVRISSSDQEAVCERQIQIEQEQQIVRQEQALILKPYNESDKLIQIQAKKLWKGYNFIETFKISQNCYKCTCSEKIQDNEESGNEIMNAHFVLINVKEDISLCMVTQREANNLLINFQKIGVKDGEPVYEKVQFYSSKTWTPQHKSKRMLARISDLQISDPLIRHCGLQNALVECKFVNGFRNFQKERQFAIMKRLLFLSLPDNFSHQELLEKIRFFLKKRRIAHKYRKSGLQKLEHEYRIASVSQLKKLGQTDLTKSTFTDE